MSPPTLRAAGSNVESRRSRKRRSVWLEIACLTVVSGVVFYLWAVGLPLSWTADYDRTRYTRIIEAIAADPQHLCGRRLDNAGQELGLEDVPWDDGNVQNLPGSYRIYHFQGFALYVHLDYMREGLTQDMLLGRGSTEERLQARNLLWIHPLIPPFVLIDGLNSREERMKRYWTRVDEEIEEINKKMREEMGHS